MLQHTVNNPVHANDLTQWCNSPANNKCSLNFTSSKAVLFLAALTQPFSGTGLNMGKAHLQFPSRTFPHFYVSKHWGKGGSLNKVCFPICTHSLKEFGITVHPCSLLQRFSICLWLDRDSSLPLWYYCSPELWKGIWDIFQVIPQSCT